MLKTLTAGGIHIARGSLRPEGGIYPIQGRPLGQDRGQSLLSSPAAARGSSARASTSQSFSGEGFHRGKHPLFSSSSGSPVWCWHPAKPRFGSPSSFVQKEMLGLELSGLRSVPARAAGSAGEERAQGCQTLPRKG